MSSGREANAPVEVIDDHRGTRRAVEEDPTDEELMAAAADHLERAEWHRARAEELLAPLNRIAAYRHEAESAVDDALPEESKEEP